jgi:hypothetical protein
LGGLEKINPASRQCRDDVSREVGKPQVVIYKAGKREMRGCFTLEKVTQSGSHFEEVAWRLK